MADVTYNGIPPLVPGVGSHDIVVNTIRDYLNEASGGYGIKSVAGSANVVLTVDEFRKRSIECTGVLTGNIAVIVPATQHFFTVMNNTTGSFTLTVRTLAGTGEVVPQGLRIVLVGDGADVFAMGYVDLLASQTLTNKRITKRVVDLVDGTAITPTGNTADLNTHVNTQAVGTLTVNAPTGTPTEFQELCLRIKSTNVQTFSANAIYRGFPAATSGGGLTDYIFLRYNFVDSKWDYVYGQMGL